MIMKPRPFIWAAIASLALVTSLVFVLSDSSSGSSTTTPTIGGSGTSLQDNSDCHAANALQFGAC